MKDAVEGVPTAQPCIVVRGTLNAIKDTVLVVERKAVTTFPPTDTPLVLLGAFLCIQHALHRGVQELLQLFRSCFFEMQKTYKED